MGTSFQPHEAYRSCRGLWLLAKTPIQPGVDIQFNRTRDAEILRVPLFKYQLNPGIGTDSDQAAVCLANGTIACTAGIQMGMCLLRCLPEDYQPILCRIFYCNTDEGVYLGVGFKQ